MGGWKDRQMERRMDGETDGRTDGIHLTIIFDKSLLLLLNILSLITFTTFSKHDSKNLHEIRLRTENAQKIRISRLGEKNGVIIKKSICVSVYSFSFPHRIHRACSTKLFINAASICPEMSTNSPTITMRASTIVTKKRCSV